MGKNGCFLNEEASERRGQQNEKIGGLFKSTANFEGFDKNPRRDQQNEKLVDSSRVQKNKKMLYSSEQFKPQINNELKGQDCCTLQEYNEKAVYWPLQKRCVANAIEETGVSKFYCTLRGQNVHTSPKTKRPVNYCTLHAKLTKTPIRRIIIATFLQYKTSYKRMIQKIINLCGHATYPYGITVAINLLTGKGVIQECNNEERKRTIRKMLMYHTNYRKNEHNLNSIIFYELTPEWENFFNETGIELTEKEMNGIMHYKKAFELSQNRPELLTNLNHEQQKMFVNMITYQLKKIKENKNLLQGFTNTFNESHKEAHTPQSYYEFLVKTNNKITKNLTLKQLIKTKQ